MVPGVLSALTVCTSKIVHSYLKLKGCAGVIWRSAISRYHLLDLQEPYNIILGALNGNSYGFQLVVSSGAGIDNCVIYIFRNLKSGTSMIVQNEEFHHETHRHVPWIILTTLEPKYKGDPQSLGRMREKSFPNPPILFCSGSI